MTTQQSSQLSEQERKQWVSEKFQQANKHLAENGVVFNAVDDNASRYLLPFFAVWKIKSNENKWYWVLSGDLPADFIPLSAAQNPREALRHFALTWQIKAENILRSGAADQTQRQFAAILQNRAEKLLVFFDDELLWKAQS